MDGSLPKLPVDEHIIIDDGSRDDGPGIVQHLCNLTNMWVKRRSPRTALGVKHGA
jgi:hypothetical protein